jgi:hypothetical protein
MRFAYWSREIAGWLLLVIGLWQFWRTYELLTNKRIFEAAPAAFIAFVVFRGGIHLLKVAVAAQAARTLPETAAMGQTRKASRMVARPVGPTPAKSVVPGPKSRSTASNGAPD